MSNSAAPSGGYAGNCLCMAHDMLTRRHPQNRKYKNTQCTALSSENDRATSTGSMYKDCKVWICGFQFWDMETCSADIQAVFDLPRGYGGLTAHWLRITPTRRVKILVWGSVSPPPPPVPLQQQQHYIQVTSRYFRMHVSDTILDYRLYETYYNDRKVVEQLTGPTSINLSR